VLELTFTAADVANTRFAISPLWEVVAAVRVLRAPRQHLLHSGWAAQARGWLAEANLDWTMLAELVGSRHIPGFVAPPPATTVPDIELELATLRATTAEQVRASLDDVNEPRTPAVCRIYDAPDEGLAELVACLESFWQLVLAPHWPHIRDVLEADIRHRAQQLAEGGAQRLLNGLYPEVSWEGDRLVVPRRYRPQRAALNGRGLLLAPSVFIWPDVFSITTPPFQPTVRYPPRGIATLWEHRTDPPPEALSAVLGRSRARLLAALGDPASTGALARRAGLTPGAVSQQLQALRAAGLVSAHRTGRYVLYSRTAVAEALLGGPVD